MKELTVTKNKDEKLELLKSHFGKGLSDDDFEIFRYVCNHTGLDPFIKQIYPIMRKQKQPDGSMKDTMVIQVGIDGLRSIAERTGNYAPGRETSYQYDASGNIVSATAYIKKMTPDGTWHEISATAFMKEYKPKYGHFWDTMPHVMIGKCAEALGIKRGFPAITANLVTAEEMAQSASLESIKVDQPMIVQGKAEKIDPEPNKEGSVTISGMTPVEELIEHLKIDDIPSDRLGEWIGMRCHLKNQSAEQIVQHCLDKRFLNNFKKSYSSWLEKVSHPEAASA